jgi:uncharacterized protein YbjT (DUF2867 family)
MTISADPTILVTGATGRVGRELVSELRRRGAAVRIASRHPDTAPGPDGTGVVAVDLSDAATLAAALDGVDAVYLMWPFFQSGEAAADAVGPVAEILGRRVKRVVYLSSETAVRQPDRFWGVVERAVEATVPEWTVLRPTGFAVNTQMWADQIRAGNVVRWPFGQAARPLIHERDIAEVAAHALLTDGHHGHSYVITGPQLVTQVAQLDAISAAVGRRLHWEELDRAAAERELHIPPEMLDAWASFITDPEPVTDEVRQITGHRARSFQSWARDHVADFMTSTGRDDRR